MHGAGNRAQLHGEAAGGDQCCAVQFIGFAASLLCHVQCTFSFSDSCRQNKCKKLISHGKEDFLLIVL